MQIETEPVQAVSQGHDGGRPDRARRVLIGKPQFAELVPYLRSSRVRALTEDGACEGACLDGKPDLADFFDASLLKHCIAIARLDRLQNVLFSLPRHFDMP
jgi:hypothetical protein